MTTTTPQPTHARRLNDWARSVHLHCTRQTAEQGRDVGLTVAEAEALFGPPPPGSNPARRLLEHAATKGFFRSVKEPHRTGKRGCWFRARYFAIGPEPEAIPERKADERRSNGYFDGVVRATSIFDLAGQLGTP